jgi:hypothetical protein
MLGPKHHIISSSTCEKQKDVNLPHGRHFFLPLNIIQELISIHSNSYYKGLIYDICWRYAVLCF